MKAIVVGGGIGGLAAAVSLRQHGWDVEVLERAAEFEEVGAGIAVLPNALRALDTLGLGDEVRKRAMPEGQAGIQDVDGRWLSRSDTAELERRHGQWAMLHRADLLDVLRSAVPEDALHAGIEVREVHTDGTVVHAGGISSADLVVGADGIRSITRRTVFPHAPAPRYAGYRTWRMIAPPRQVRSVETWGKGDRFGYAPLPDGRVYCYAVVKGPEGASGDIHALRRRFADWHDPIPALLDSVADDALLGHDSYDLPDLPSFVSGRVALLGDAAHAMTPNLGQGGCQALEDAVVLGAADDLAAYDRARRPRAQMIVRRSRRVGVVAHWTSPVAVAARNTAMRLAPGSALIRSMEPVLSWTP